MGSRRDFIKHSGSVLALSALSPYTLDVLQRAKPWRVSLIGTGWYGTSDLLRLIQVANIEVVGLCDVDSRQLHKAEMRIRSRISSKYKLPTYSNYQDMLRQQQPEIVLIGSPDHWHALQAIDSIKSGAHVYLQKPVSVDVLEGEAILATARKYNKVVQIGTQRRSTHHLIDAKNKIINEGKLGKVSHVEMCCYYHMRANKSPAIQPIPDHLDYENYVGPAPYRPYDGLPHRGWWRALMEYSNGIMGDMCVHMYDTVRWLLDLGWADQVYSSGGIYMQKDSKANTADTQTAIFSHKELNCTWQHRSWGPPTDPEYPWGFFIYGEKGVLKGSVNKYEFIPNDGKNIISQDVLFEREDYPEDINEEGIELHVAAATRAHMADFLMAIETDNRPVADIEQGHISTANCILANMSMKLGRPLKYNPTNQTIEGDEEATKLLKRGYREGWTHPHF